MKICALIITPELLRLISEIEEFKGSWKTITTLAPEILASLRRVATIESIGSSARIEGAKLTDQEVAGYADVMDTIASPLHFRIRTYRDMLKNVRHISPYNYTRREFSP